MIPEHHAHNVIQSGIFFMRSITTAYGSDEGMKLWDTISNTLDPDIKGRIFFAMITGDYEDSITVYFKQITNPNKVSMIKAIRTVTGDGLKEAKDKVDDFLMFGKPLTLKCSPDKRAASIQELHNAGFYI